MSLKDEMSKLYVQEVKAATDPDARGPRIIVPVNHVRLHCSKCARIPKPGSGNYCPCGGRFHDHVLGMYCGPHCPRKSSEVTTP